MWDFISRIVKRGNPSTTALGHIVPRPAVRDTLMAVMRAPLAEQGFELSGKGRFVRHSSFWVDIVDLQFLKVRGLPANSPSIHLGRFLTFVPPDSLQGEVASVDGRKCPNVEQCHLRRMVYKTIVQRETKAQNVWFIGSESENLALCGADIDRAVAAQILPWFAWLSDLRNILHLVQSVPEDVEGHSHDPVRRGTWGYGGYFGKKVIAGFVALELEEYELAEKLLDQVVVDGGVVGKGGRVFPLPETSQEQIRYAIALAKRSLSK